MITLWHYHVQCCKKMRIRHPFPRQLLQSLTCKAWVGERVLIRVSVWPWGLKLCPGQALALTRTYPAALKVDINEGGVWDVEFSHFSGKKTSIILNSFLFSKQSNNKPAPAPAPALTCNCIWGGKLITWSLPWNEGQTLLFRLDRDWSSGISQRVWSRSRTANFFVHLLKCVFICVYVCVLCLWYLELESGICESSEQNLVLCKSHLCLKLLSCLCSPWTSWV